MNHIIRRIEWIVKNSSNLLHGYNIYVNKEKLHLIKRAFKLSGGSVRSFVDLGGVWKVNGGYTKFTLKNFDIDRGYIIDTDYPEKVLDKLKQFKNLNIIKGDFTSPVQIEKLKQVDIIYLFDVLLHQANPNWDEVLTRYSTVAKCFVIFNQQFVNNEKSIRLTDLTLDDYKKIVPPGKSREELYNHVFSHKDEIHPVHGKPWKDIHNIFQWGITDNDLRSRMNQLGFSEIYYKNYGRFSNLPEFENHGFIFVRE